MREIKFRAWNVETKEMFPVSDLNFWVDRDGKNGFAIGIRFEDEIDPLFGDPTTECIPMQYTGLKDKNGKEIYEGDIVHDSTDSFNRNGLISWQRAGFWYEPIVPEGMTQFGGYLYQDDLSTVEVIGNIHENPELIK